MKSDNRYYHLYSADKVLAFEKRLNEIGIKINPDSDLYRIGFDVLEVYDKHKNPDLHDNYGDLRENMRQVMGFNNFIEKVTPLLNSEYIDEIIPHLELLNKSSIPQTMKAKVTDQGSNKLFELYTSGLCYPQFQNIRLDSPISSKGNNPDVMFSFENRRWGIACKVLHSPQIQSIIDNVIKGLEQIEKSESDTGFVLISLRNIIDYDDFWPILNKEEFLKNNEEPLFGSYLVKEIPAKKLENYVLDIQDKLQTDIGIKELLNIFKNKKAQPVVVVFLQGATGIIDNGSPVFSLLGFLGMLRMKEVPNYAVKVLEIISDKIN